MRLRIEFIDPKKESLVAREYDLRVSRGRRAFLVFAKWAMYNSVSFRATTTQP